MYTRVIVNELGEIEEYVSDLTGAEVNEILDEHPEWKIKLIPYNCQYKEKRCLKMTFEQFDSLTEEEILMLTEDVNPHI